MKALILNSGLGRRMGPLTSCQPKCLTNIPGVETILGRQLRQITGAGITEVVITTGYYGDALKEYCEGMQYPLSYTFVNNSNYQDTNYIYSIYLAREFLDGDIILMHGDLVFEDEVLWEVVKSETSCVVVKGEGPLPEKDFKAVVKNGIVTKIGVDFFQNAVAAQPLYYLRRKDWSIWLAEITEFCKKGNVQCYAEDALNMRTDACRIAPLDVGGMLCSEVDNLADLAAVSEKLKGRKKKSVYMCFSTDSIHSGHIAIIKKAACLGDLTVGILSDRAVASYKRFPLLPFEERSALFANMKGVTRVIKQENLSYRDVLQELKPEIVVHGSDWREGFQRPLRDEVVAVLDSYGGRLMEFPYSDSPKYQEIDQRSRIALALPDNRRGRLKKILGMKGLLRVMEAHDGISGLIVENTSIHDSSGGVRAFDAIWVSSLCDSLAKGKPDIELVDMTSRFRTIDDLTEVTTKPIIFDGDTGGKIEHFVYTVKTLEKMGVSAVIIEDKRGLKKNSLLGAEAAQVQESVEAFSAKITAGKRVQKSPEFMIIARIESLILEKGMEDALYRAFAFVDAGADGIMIHSRKKDPEEIFTFVRCFREKNTSTPLVVTPTAFHSVTEEELQRRGVNVVIYANQLMRSEVPAMRNTAETILKYHRAMEADVNLMPFEEIIRMVPAEL